jgi:putative transposase
LHELSSRLDRSMRVRVPSNVRGRCYVRFMPRYRLEPTVIQEAALREYCSHARFVWNLACEQQSWWRSGRGCLPSFTEQCRQLSEARAAFGWLASGSVIVQQQALRDFAHAMDNFFNQTHGRPSWRKAGRHEGFRIVAVKPKHFRRLNRKIAAVWVPKVGWIRLRMSRAIPRGVKSYRVTCDPAGRWHVALAVIPPTIPGPGTGETVGVDRGVTASAALSTGELLRAPRLSPAKQRRMRLLQRKLRRRSRGSHRRAHTRVQIARLYAKQSDMRKDWCEKTSTSLAHRFDWVYVEDLQIKSMTRSAKGNIQKPGKNVRQKSGLNREILASGWGLLIRRLENKAPGRVQKVNPAFTSQRCSACGHIAAESRKSQALFCCVACAYSDNADVNAAKNIAAGHAVTARGGFRSAGPLNREPQPLRLHMDGETGIPADMGWEDVKSFRP